MVLPKQSVMNLKINEVHEGLAKSEDAQLN